MRRSRSTDALGSGGGRPSLALRVKSNLPVSNNQMSSSRSSSGGRFSTGQGSSSNSRSSSAGRSSGIGINQKNQHRSSYGQHGIIGGKQRGSGYGRTFGNDPMKDPRPLFDRSSRYKDQCIKNLIDFLMLKHYPHKISVRILHSPSTKEVIHIFEFLYAFIQPGYTMGTKKHEEEIPKIMKSIEYPFNLNKNMMFTIGAPHTWPHILGALVWLMEFIESALYTNIENLLFPHDVDDFEQEPESLILFNYYAKSYNMYMAGADTFTEVEEDLINSLKMRYAGCGGSVEQLAETNRRLMAELDELQKEPDRLASVQEYHYNISKDKVRFKEYLEKMEALKTNLVKKLAETDEELNNVELEIQRLTKDVKHKRHILETQNISQIDVQRINRGSQELRRQNEALQREISENEKQIWTFEMGMSKRLEKMDERCQNYGQLLLKLKMNLPADAYISTDDLKCDARSENLNILKERLMRSNEIAQTKYHETLAHLHHEMELLEQVKEAEEEKLTSQESLERRLESMNNELDVKNKAMVKEENQPRMEMNKIQQNINEIREELICSSSSEVADKLAACQKKTEKQIEEARQEKNEWTRFMEEVIDLVIEHKQFLIKTFQDLKDEFDTLHAEYKMKYEQDMSALNNNTAKCEK